jgi:hypothetical protein
MSQSYTVRARQIPEAIQRRGLLYWRSFGVVQSATEAASLPRRWSTMRIEGDVVERARRPFPVEPVRILVGLPVVPA